MLITKAITLIRTHRSSFQNQIRTLTELKKFYKNASITRDNGNYEVNLDQRKLRTPGGSILQLKSEPLALMIANEWNSQRNTIQLPNMHLTTLANTSQDNPLRLEKQSMVESMLEHLSSDTLSFRMREPEELYELQTKQWDPVLHWFERTFQARLPITDSVFLDQVPSESRLAVGRYLMSHNQASLFGFQFVLDNLKSIVLSLALVHRHLTVTEAVSLSRLEQEFQIARWGSVEWAHDTDLMLLRSRVSAGLIFFFLNHEMSSIQKHRVNSSS